MNMENYVRASLETHLFFGRIMKEHALFLQAGFPAGETGYRSKASGTGTNLKRYCSRPYGFRTAW